MIVTIVIIAGTALLLALLYRGIVDHGDGLGNHPIRHQTAVCTPDRHNTLTGYYGGVERGDNCVPTIGHIATPQEWQAQREATRKYNADRWVRQLEQEWKPEGERVEEKRR